MHPIFRLQRYDLLLKKIDIVPFFAKEKSTS
jgi:hypothetical protein